MSEQLSMDPQAILLALRDKVEELEDRLQNGLGKITREPNTAQRLHYESFFVGLLREYEHTVRVWAKHELDADPGWMDPRLSYKLLEEIREDESGF